MAARRKKDTIARDEVCPEHFPGGVPEGTATVGCDHGTFHIAPEDPKDPPENPDDPENPGPENPAAARAAASRP